MENTLTIAIIQEIFLPTVNGVVTSSINLAVNLKKLGHKVFFIAPSWFKYRENEVDGIPIHYIPSVATHMYPGIRLISPFSKKMAKIIDSEDVDIVHVTGPWLLARAAILAARKKNIPVVQTFHTLIYEDTYLIYFGKTNLLMPFLRKNVWWYIGRFVKKSDVMTAPSRHACDTLVEHFPDMPVVHIRNGVNLEEFKEQQGVKELKTKYPEFNEKTFIFVGRLGEEKSVSVLIRAFVEAYKKDNELRLFLIGDGPGRREYERIVKNEGLTGSVFFLGRLDYHELITGGLYHHARALVTASTTENQPVTVLEAIACNTPVIIPDVNGINELLDKNGLFFEAGNIKDFAEKMVTMANEDAVYNDCKAGGLKLREEFEGLKIAGQFEKLYQDVMSSVSAREKG